MRLDRAWYLLRWVGAASLPLAFAVFGLLCLWAGLVLGVVFVQTGASVVHGFLEIELISKFVPEALHRNPSDVLSVMSVMPLVVAESHGELIKLTKDTVETSLNEQANTLYRNMARQADEWNESRRAVLLKACGLVAIIVLAFTAMCN